MSSFRAMLIALFTSALLVVSVTPLAATCPPCYYYAGPSGSGTTCSSANPCTVQTGLTKLIAGDTLWLEDGHYTGASSMIVGGTNQSGTNSNFRLNVKAVNDGMVDIDGEGARLPIHLSAGNNWWWIEGMNAHSSGPNTQSLSTVDIGGSHNVIRRIVAWDAPIDCDCSIFKGVGTMIDDTTAGYSNTFEDDAAFGTGKKMFETFDSDGNTFRRCWARWEGSIETGPKRDIEVNYNSYNTIVDDFIAEWDGHLVPATYTVQDNGHNYVASSCDHGVLQGTDCVYTNFVQEAVGAIGDSDPGSQSKYADDKISGVLGLPVGSYQSKQSGESGLLTLQYYGNSVLKDIFVVMGQSVVDLNGVVHPPGVVLANGNGAPASTTTNLTTVAQVADTISGSWGGSNLVNYLHAPCPFDGVTTCMGLGSSNTLYQGTTGAHLCYQYNNGSLTSTPLWPWPMSARIKAATMQASSDGHYHQVEDVDGRVQAIFGPYPPACKTP